MATLSEQDRENLSAYLDGELDEETAQALEAKINLDPEVRKEVDALKQTWGLLDYLPRPQPSSGFTNRTLERLSLEKMGRAMRTGKMPRYVGPWLRVLGWVAAVLIAIGAGVGAANLLSPKGRDGADLDESLVRHLRILEKWRLYENVVDIDFLRNLDQPDLFAEDQGS
jgi:anti-sigma factor RsiW